MKTTNTTRFLALSQILFLLSSLMFLSAERVASAAAAAGRTARVSVSSNGEQANSGSSSPSISTDGRFVGFVSAASNLVDGDTNEALDVFVHDRQTAATELISVSTNGEQGDDRSYGPSLSADGRYVAFYSYASNLVSEDTNSGADVFVRDRQTGTTEQVSVSSSGEQGNTDSHSPSISADGRFVAFASYATNLVEGDTNEFLDIFVHDRETRETEMVSVTSSGEQGMDESYGPSISDDGRFVAFVSKSSNLVDGDMNTYPDIFVHDRETGETECVSVSPSGEPGNTSSIYPPSISADGRFVSFASISSDLVDGDTNERWDIFVRDRQAGTTGRVSVSSSGEQGNYGSYGSSISADGRFVAFYSYDSILVEGDTNDFPDIFVHDRQTGVTALASVSTFGEQGNNESFDPSISGDGRFVAFHSMSTNLVDEDTNDSSDIFVHDSCPDDSCLTINLFLPLIARQ